MFRNFLKNSLLFSFLFIISLSSLGDQVIKISDKGSDKEILEKYFKIHEEFTKKVCRGDQEKFWQYFRDYKREGRFIPLLEKVPSLASLDAETLSEGMPYFKKKLDWIDQQIFFLKKNEKLNIKQEIQTLRLDIKNLLKIKEKYFFYNKDVKEDNKKAFEKLRTDYDHLLNKIPFMLNFMFPVDYKDYRERFDEVKNEKFGEKGKLKNKIYFERKLIEDGLLNDKELSIDHFTRALLNTLFVRIKNHKDNDFIDEDLRYDFYRVLLKLEEILSPSSYKGLLSKFQKWRVQTENNYYFYESLLDNFKKGNNDFVKSLVGSREILKKFNFEKQAEVYKYWIEEGELFSALFVLETILIHEVGGLDKEDFGERERIAQLVINRYLYKQFHLLDENDELRAFLLKDFSLEKMNERGAGTWMNILFKQGEFSFTYFFLPLSVGIYCPDLAPMAKRLREENLLMSLKLLKEPHLEFTATRFYSRHSMLGGLAMEDLWGNYERVPEEVLIENKNYLNQKKYLKKLMSSSYLYLFPISELNKGDNKNFHVIDVSERPWIKSKPLVLKKDSKTFYPYRNSQYFRYFKLKKDLR